MRIQTKDTNPEGGGGLEAGWCHLLVESAVEDPEAGKLTVEYIVRASTAPGNVGKKKTDFFNQCDSKGNFSSGSTNRMLKFFCAVGLLTKQQWEDAVNGGGHDIQVDGIAAVGRQLCSNLTMQESKSEKSKGKKFAETGFSLFRLDDPEAKDCPKDAAAAKFMEGILAGSKPSGNGAAKGKSGGKAAARPADDEFADL